MKGIPTPLRSVTRAYGGNLCHQCLRDRYVVFFADDLQHSPCFPDRGAEDCEEGGFHQGCGEEGGEEVYEEVDQEDC